MLKKRKEEEQRKKVKDFEEERERRNVEAQEEWEKWETERRVHDQDWRRDVESERAQARQQYKVFEDQQSSGRMWADDPMMEGVREKVVHLFYYSKIVVHKSSQVKSFYLSYQL